MAGQMRDDTKKARRIMERESLTCVLCLGERIYKSKERGVKPLLEMIDSGAAYKGFCAADKVVGSAAAYLYTLLEIDELYAAVISERALRILKDGGIGVQYDACTNVIRNRQNTGICPMEDAVCECTTAEQALAAIRERLAGL